MTIRDFIQDEVERQGFTRGSNNFFVRVGAMLAAWNHAREFSGPLGASVVRLWGMMVEPEVNFNGWRTCNVRVGATICPDWQDIPRLMDNWTIGLDSFTPDEAYLEFERVHPFRDGNGRTGKIIHNRLLKSLDSPVLIKDYFGGGNP